MSSRQAAWVIGIAQEGLTVDLECDLGLLAASLVPTKAAGKGYRNTQAGLSIPRPVHPRVRMRGLHATDLIVESTDVQGCVPRGILRTHVGAIEEQMFQMLDMAVPAGLRQETE